MTRLDFAKNPAQISKVCYNVYELNQRYIEGNSSMNKRFLTVALVFMMVFLAACKPTGSQSDPNSAQNLQPSITGFRTQNLDVGATAILTSAAGGSAVTGNIPLAAAIQRGDALLQCLQDTGS